MRLPDWVRFLTAAGLLFEGAKLLPPNNYLVSDKDAVVRMSRIQVQKIVQGSPDSNAVNVYFDYGGKQWLVYRDSTGKAQLVQVGRPLLLPAGAVTLPAVIKHYDARNVLLRTIELDRDGLVIVMTQHVAGAEVTIPAKAGVFQKGSDTAYAQVFYSGAGTVTKVTYYRYDMTRLPALQAPANAMTFPSTLEHYDARSVLLREIVMLNDDPKCYRVRCGDRCGAENSRESSGLCVGCAYASLRGTFFRDLLQ